MKREIKFRAWDKDKKKMIYPDGKRWGFKLSSSFLGTGMNRILILSPDGDLIKYEKGDNDIRPETEVVNEEYELMQFTNLLDKNGKEIYEGDVMSSPVQVVERGTNNYTATFMPPNVVGYEGHEFTLYLGGNKDVHISMSPDEETGKRITEETEIIGNIYENPELLK